MWRNLGLTSIIFTLSNAYRYLIVALLVAAAATGSADLGPPKRATKYKSRYISPPGSTLRLSCPVEADPPAIVSWVKDGQRIHFGWERYHTKRNRLVIDQLESGDSGSFVCTATNGFGTVTARHLVYVEDDNQTTLENKRRSRIFFNNLYTTTDSVIVVQSTVPTVASGGHDQQSITRKTGSKVKLRCRESGRGYTNITWFKDGVKLEDYAGRRMLILKYLTETDEGNYVCISISGTQLLTSSYHVTLSDPSPVGTPLLSTHHNNVTLAIGDSVTLVCQIYSESQLTVQWLRPLTNMKETTQINQLLKLDDVSFAVLQQNVFNPRHTATTLYHSNMTLTKVNYDDAGVYVCLGQNKQGYTYLSSLVVVDSAYRNSKSNTTETRAAVFETWMAIGAVTLFVVIIIACILFTLIRRRYRQHNVRPVRQMEPRERDPSTGKQSSLMFDHQYAVLEPIGSETMSDGSRSKILV